MFSKHTASLQMDHRYWQAWAAGPGRYAKTEEHVWGTKYCQILANLTLTLQVNYDFLQAAEGSERCLLSWGQGGPKDSQGQPVPRHQKGHRTVLQEEHCPLQRQQTPGTCGL